MKNRNGRLMSVADFQAELAQAPEKLFAVAGDERLLARLPKGSWLGGSIPYLMCDEGGGLTTRDSLMVQELLTDERAAPKIKFYDKNTIARVTEDAPANGYTFVMMPAFSEVHLAYGKDAPRFKDLFAHPIVGWVTGIHLNDLGKETPKVFNGKTGEVFADQAIACHVSLPAGKTADVEIVNIFERSEGPTHDVAFACNCVLNFLYGKLDGARVGLPGPYTFGEIGYQLLNQTMVYLDVVDAGVPHEGGRYFAQQMSTAR